MINFTNITYYQQVLIYNEEAQFTSHPSCNKYISCHKALVVITGRAHCFHGSIWRHSKKDVRHGGGGYLKSE